MDFYDIVMREKKGEDAAFYPDWVVGKSKDLMTRGGQFYAVWNDDHQLWSTDIHDVQRIVDYDVATYAEEYNKRNHVAAQWIPIRSHSTKLWTNFLQFVHGSGNNYHALDEKLVFANTEVKQSDYASKRLPYALEEGPCPAWDTIVGTLYSEEERSKIEWAIGAIVSGDSKQIQKFLVFYGAPGTGKSTILNIIERLFEGYTSVFDAKELAGNNNTFATGAFHSNPLVAIQHDGDLSKIVDNTKLNSIVAHEILTVNEKYMRPYETRLNAFLLMGTNQPVKITDAKSGVIRRLIDVTPTGQTIDHDTYHVLMDQVNHELGAIAAHCLKVYKEMGKNYYSHYKAEQMMLQTDVFYNFIEANFDIFKRQDGVTLKQAWTLYKEFCEETGVSKPMPQYKMREQLKDYFHEFHTRIRIEGQEVRSYYQGFNHLTSPTPKSDIPVKVEGEYVIDFEEQPSVFDEHFPTQPAQLANEDGIPRRKWVNVDTTLADIDTSEVHYVKVPKSHIVIDFDLTDELGNKSLDVNLEEASKWPVTYAEVSKGGNGIHLHYEYSGDVEELSNLYSDGIEIKTLLGDSSLRRRLSKCNNVNIATLSTGLPKKEKRMLGNQSIKSEKGLRDLIVRNLRKEIHPGTRPSVDFIKKILDEAYEAGLPYDLRDMRGDILTFASRSTHHAGECMKMVKEMQFVSEDQMPDAKDQGEGPIVFFDVEVYPNLFVVCWKKEGEAETVRMVNPSADDIEPLLGMKLVGFNNRRYDNHILYARYIGYSLEELYHLSSRIVNSDNNQGVLFGEAYNLSYADIYDFSSVKQGLKKFQIELGIFHLEMDIPWDAPVSEDMWDKVVEYCVNDVVATEAVFEDRRQDFVARQILADISGLSVNHSTQSHTAKIIFGDDREPQKKFTYTDLSEMFEGYKFDGKESHYRGEITGEGGYVYAEPGIYDNIALLDVASMHPTSIEVLDLFGPYTANFSDLKAARLAIKRGKLDEAGILLDGKLKKFLGGSDEDLEALSYALKIVINIVYGLTSARFPNKFKDNRNKDNIVAKYGALFMVDLKHFVQEQGFTVAHIKTDSIKIPNATPEIIQAVTNFGATYGFEFEHEATYDKLCLVNDAVYIAREGDKWTAVGAQFQHPYVYKTLFTKQDIVFEDLCEAKSVRQGTMHLDLEGDGKIENMRHIGRNGVFVPVASGGGTLYRVKDDKAYAVTGTKGYKWIESTVANEMFEMSTLDLDQTYFDNLVDKARKHIEEFGNYEEFVNG